MAAVVQSMAASAAATPANNSTASPNASARSPSRSDAANPTPMSIATVKAHVSRLLEKLEFNNRVQTALLAHDAGEA